MATTVTDTHNHAPKITVLARFGSIPVVSGSLDTINKVLTTNSYTRAPYVAAKEFYVAAYKYTEPIQVRLAPLIVRADGLANKAVDAVEARYPYPFKSTRNAQTSGPSTLTSQSLSSVPLTGIFMDPSVTLNTQMETIDELGEPTLIGTTVGLLHNAMAVHISKEFHLDPAIHALDMEDSPTLVPSAQDDDLLSSVGPAGIMVHFSPKFQNRRRIRDHLGKQENINLMEQQNYASLKAELKKVMDTVEFLKEGFKQETDAREDLHRLLQKERADRREENSELRRQLEKERADRREVTSELQRQLEKERADCKEVTRELQHQVEKEIAAREDLRQQLEKKIDAGVKQLEKEKADRKEETMALQHLTSLVTLIHLRVLLDQAREKVLDILKCESWEVLREEKGAAQLADEIYAGITNVEHCPSKDTLEFLCSNNYIRRTANSAAHTASPEEVQTAVTTQPLDSKSRRMMEELFTFTYDLSV